MTIRVVNVRGLNRAEQRAGVVYVGRAFAGWPKHPLCNPLRPNQGLTLEDCLNLYRGHLARLNNLPERLSQLWQEMECGVKPLGCWCVNATAGDGSEVVCHAQVLAELLQERFGAK